MPEQFDAVVVGSGFGGSVTACRLAQAGMKVCILERGRWWAPEEFPLHNPDPGAWLWTGWSKGLYAYHVFNNMDVLAASGVGGGSLIYANVQIIPPARVFEQGWPAAITLSSLAPYYRQVEEMLHPSPYPHPLPSKTRALREGAKLIGREEAFRLLNLAIYWGQPGVPNADPYGFGTAQTGCESMGECVTGCPVQAKNTLNLNYLALALQKGALCRPLQEVTHIARDGDSFTLAYLDRTGSIPRPGVVKAARVILAAGTLGSANLLLKAQREKSLGLLSPALGHGFSANGNFLAMVTGLTPPVDIGAGPTITAMVGFDSEEFIIEDGGFPPVIPPIINSLPLLLIGRDAADGQLKLKGLLLEPVLHWSPEKSMPLFRAMEQKSRELAEALGGQADFLPGWLLARKLITLHPLGGCRMADSPLYGVVDEYGAVYGQPGLYVADGSIIPTALGVNPSMTIAALAERIAENIIRKG